MNKKTFDRRDFLKLAGLTTLGAVSACAPSSIAAATAAPTRTSLPATQPTATPIPEKQKKRVLRIAHMTDFHVEPKGIAPVGMANALYHAQNQADPPDVILNTGDSIMDALETSKSTAVGQWLTYKSIMKSECSLPVIHAIGNHDVWGWELTDW